MDENEAAEALAFLETELPEGSEFSPIGGMLRHADLSWIGRELREYYDGILREPVPQRLLALLDQGLARRTFH